VGRGIATDLIVFGRGLDVGPGGEFVLSEAGRARVRAALVHVGAHAELFAARRVAGRPGRVVFSGGWAGAAEGVPRPPERWREGRLMLDLALATDVDGQSLDSHVDAFAEIESESTLENAVRVWEGGWFSERTFSPDAPLGLVAHAGHMDRADYFTRQVFRLPRDAVQHIVAPGADRDSGGLPEAQLYRVTRLFCLGARTPRSLRRRERLMRRAARLSAVAARTSAGGRSPGR
jgi:hypothetical protein